MEKLVSLLGMVIMVGVAYLMSSNKKKINWKLVGIGISMQVIFGIIVLKWQPGQKVFDLLNKGVMNMLGFSKMGSKFVFGHLADLEQTPFVFAFQILPTIIFFSAFMSLLYYLKIMDKIVVVLAKVMSKLLGTSGAESLSCTANIFVGHTEAPLVIKPFIGRMTSSEILTVMTGGMATVAGGVMAGYVAMGVDASHLIAASIMSAPAALVISKIILPETEIPETMGKVEVGDDHPAENAIDAVAHGASDGLKLALNVAAMMLAFLSLVAMLNGLLSWIGSVVGMDFLSLQWILGKIFSPLALIMGIPMVDVFDAGSLLGQKIAINEFFAYSNLSTSIATGNLQPRTITILTYALCGFANFASIGVQCGGLGALVPEKRSEIAKLGIRALVGGNLAAFMTATIAGMLL